MSVDVPKVLLRPREKQKIRKTVRHGPNVRRRAKSAPSTCQKQKNRKTVRLVPMSVDVPTVLLRKTENRKTENKTVRLVPMSVDVPKAPLRRAKNRKTEKLYKASPNVRRRAKSAPSTCQKQKNRKTVRLVPMSVDVPKLLLRPREKRKTEKL